MSLLNAAQKAKLAQLARRAWQHVGRTAAESRPDFDAWRRAEVFAACGKHGLTQATNADFNLIAARFHSLLGEDGVALNELLRAGTEQRRQMEAVLLRELGSAGLNQRYAESIARARFGANVSDLNDAQFRQLLITVKNRARAKRNQRTEVAA